MPYGCGFIYETDQQQDLINTVKKSFGLVKHRDCVYELNVSFSKMALFQEFFFHIAVITEGVTVCNTHLIAKRSGVRMIKPTPCLLGSEGEPV
jgi:hypothetical protein